MAATSRACRKMFVSKFFLLATIFNPVHLADGNVQVTIKGVGKVRGSSQIREGKVLDSFWAIPFAEPPVGNLRFAPPQPAKPWSGIRNATVTRIICPQVVPSTNKIVGVEDCLYLNIFRPREATKKKMPVFFWIHGGSFIQGSAFNYNGDVISAKQEVVVVALNYRLGLLGFFNVPGSRESPNYALLDQILALKWVSNHISDFGGDPSKVTIAGISAGAGCASLLMLSPLAKGLFARAIPQSGSPLAVWVARETANKTFAEDIVKKLGCTDLSKAVTCLRKVSWQDVIKTQVAESVSAAVVVPYVDDYVIKEYPYKQFKEGKLPLSDIDLLIGFTKDEGSMFVPLVKPLTKAVMKAVMGKDLKWNYGPDVAMVAEMVSFYYEQERLPYHPDFATACKLFLDDFYFEKDIINFAGAWAKKRNRTYVYEFTYHPKHALYPHWNVAHAIEKAFVFGTPLRQIRDPWRKNELVGNFTDDDKIVSENIMKMWTDFVKTGKPNPDWPSFDALRRRYMQININNTVKEDFNPRMLAFWNEYVPTILKMASAKRPSKSNISGSVCLMADLVNQFTLGLLCLFLCWFY